MKVDERMQTSLIVHCFGIKGHILSECCCVIYCVLRHFRFSRSRSSIILQENISVTCRMIKKKGDQLLTADLQIHIPLIIYMSLRKLLFKSSNIYLR
jgi:hypothetical protein